MENSFGGPISMWRDAARGIQLVLNSPTEKVGGKRVQCGIDRSEFRTKQQLVEMIHPLTSPKPMCSLCANRKIRGDYRVSFARITDQLGFKHHAIGCRRY